MPQLTPPLSGEYRRHGLVVLRRLITGAKGNVAAHLVAVEGKVAAGEEAAAARADLGFAQRVLVLLRGRQRFLRSDRPPPLDQG